MGWEWARRLSRNRPSCEFFTFLMGRKKAPDGPTIGVPPYSVGKGGGASVNCLMRKVRLRWSRLCHFIGAISVRTDTSGAISSEIYKRPSCCCPAVASLLAPRRIALLRIHLRVVEAAAPPPTVARGFVVADVRRSSDRSRRRSGAARRGRNRVPVDAGLADMAIGAVRPGSDCIPRVSGKGAGCRSLLCGVIVLACTLWRGL
jgi:hypothetical protein